MAERTNDFTKTATENARPTEQKDSSHSWLWVAGIILAAAVLAAVIAGFFYNFHFKPERNANPAPRSALYDLDLSGSSG